MNAIWRERSRSYADALVDWLEAVLMDEVREATLDDLDTVVEMMHAQRLRYQEYSPVFWRVSPFARDVHRPFLEMMISSPDFVSLVAHDVSGCLFGLRRPSGWLVDDFTVVDPRRWSGLGRALLTAAVERTGHPLTVVCGERDVDKRAMLRDAGMVLSDEWWIGLPAEAVGNNEASFDLIDAPPVYDPGGKVAMAKEWVGSAEGLQRLLADAGRAGAVLVIVATPADESRRPVLVESGLTIASEWYITQSARS